MRERDGAHVGGESAALERKEAKATVEVRVLVFVCLVLYSVFRISWRRS